MEKIFLDSEFRCHVTNSKGIFREVVLSKNAKEFFANKCIAFIEGYRLKPDNETWIREDRKVFSGGEMLVPWKPYAELAAAQAQYEHDLADAAAAYQEGVNTAYDK